MAFKPIFHFRNPDSTFDLNSAYSSAISKGIYTGGDITVSSANLNVTVSPFTAVAFDGLVVKTDAPVSLTVLNGKVNVIALFAKYEKNNDPIIQLRVYEEASITGSLFSNYYVIFGKVDLTGGGYTGLLLEGPTPPPVNKAFFSFSNSNYGDKNGVGFKQAVSGFSALPVIKNRIGDVRYAIAEQSIYAWDVSTRTWYNVLATTSTNVAYAGGPNWADGSTNPAASVETQLDKIIRDLGGVTTRTGTGDSISGTAPLMSLNDAGGAFLAAEVGGYITITSATTPANNGTFRITARISSTVISYVNMAGVAEAYTGAWTLSLSGGGADKISTQFISGAPVDLPPNKTIQEALAIFVDAINKRGVIADTNLWTADNTFTQFTYFNSGANIEETPITAALATNQDNYSPTSTFDHASVVRLNPSVAVSITGFNSVPPPRLEHSPPALVARKTIINVGSYTITFKHDTTSSSSINRILTPGGIDYVLYPNESVIFLYDTAATRWFILDKLNSTQQISDTIGVSTNNYSPMGWSTASIVHINSNAGSGVNIDITGFSSDVVVKRKKIVFFSNYATSAGLVPAGETLTIVNNSLLSNSENRIRTNLNFANYTLQTRDSFEIYYDTTLNGWRILPHSVSRSDYYNWLGGHSFTPKNAGSNGLLATGNTTGAGVYAVGGTTGAGVYGIGGSSGLGGYFQGKGNNAGIYGLGGPTSGAGVHGEADALGNGHGGFFQGKGTGRGVYAIGGITDGTGGYFVGAGSGDGDGIEAFGSGTGEGGAFTGGSTGTGGRGITAVAGGSVEGVLGRGGPTGGIGSIGVIGEGILAGVGGKFTGGASTVGVVGNGGGATGTGVGLSVAGVVGYGGFISPLTSGTGVVGLGGGTNGHGVAGLGLGSGSGGVFTGGNSTGGTGVVGLGGTLNGLGGYFVGTGTSDGTRTYSTGSGDGVVGISQGAGAGVVGTAQGGGRGGSFTGDGSSSGIYAVGGSSNGAGVLSYGDGNGIGVGGYGSGTGPGGYFQGGGTGYGINCLGGTGAAGGYFTGSGSYGIYATATGSISPGISCLGSTGGSGIEARGGTNGIGVTGIGAGTAVGGHFTGGSSAAAIRLIPRSGPPASEPVGSPAGNPGDIWFDSTGVTGKFRGRNNTGVVDLG